MMAPSDVTVIVPTAKRPRELTDTIQSFLAQSTPPRKIIAVANGREDVERCIQEDRRITVLLHGGSSAGKRNATLSHVEGRYVFFVDDDVELHPA